MPVCASCASANPDEARFCSTCGTPLVARCLTCDAALPDGARFCPSCGTPAGDAAPDTIAPVGQERRIVTLLFADVTGSTALGERLDAERLHDILEVYFSAMREEIESQGGTTEKFIGDAVVAAFGVPTAHEDDPARALRAALRMQRRLDDVNGDLRATHGVALRIRIGVNTGEVLAAVDPRPGEPMFTGDAVNVAARFEQAAEPGQVVASERTARAVRGFRFRPLGPLSLKGKSAPVEALEVLGEQAAARRGVPGLSAPMVGRERELDLLRTTFDRVVGDGRPHLVTVYGDAGIGKSRLTREFLDELGASGSPPTLLQARCLPYGDGITYWPLAEILRASAGIRDTDTPEQALDKIAGTCDAALLGGSVDAGRTCAALAYTMGIEDPAHPMGDREPRQVRTEMHAAWRGFFTSLAGAGPVAVLIDDIHWADAALLDLLEDLAERVDGPVLFVCPARPTLTDRRPTWGGGRRNATGIVLDPLTAEEAERLVSQLLAVEDLPSETRSRILQRADGNPFFLEEILRQLIDEGRILHVDGAWRAAQDIADVEIPDTVQGVLSARIDLLEPADRKTLQLAAVVGRVFWPGPVALLLNGERASLGQILDRLEGRDLVRARAGSSVSGEDEYAFKHVLTRDVAYERLPRRERGRAHAAVADWIERSAGPRGEFGELLAYHLEAALRAEQEDPRGDDARVESLRARSFAATMRAGDDLRRRFAVSKALALGDRALSLATTPEERVAAFEQLGRTAQNGYRGDRAWGAFRAAADIRRREFSDDRLGLALACARAVEVPRRWPGSMQRVPEQSEIDAFVDVGVDAAGDTDSEPLVRLLAAQAFRPFAAPPDGPPISDKEVAEAQAAGTRAADMARRLGRPDLESEALDGWSSANVAIGRYGDFEPIRRRLALPIDDPWELGDIYSMAAWFATAAGDYREAVDHAIRGVEAVGPEAVSVGLHCHNWRCYAEFERGRWTEILREIVPAVLARSEGGDWPYFMASYVGVTAMIYQARRMPEAADAIAQVEHQADSSLGRQSVAGAWYGWLMLRAGRLDEAERSLAEMRGIAWRAPRMLVAHVDSLLLAEAERWSEVPDFLERGRSYARDAGLKALPLALDRLEARMALAQDRPEEALRTLAGVVDGFDRLDAAWERSCAEVDLARSQTALGHGDEARAALEHAAAAFRRMGAIPEIELVGRLLAQLDP